jgi:hypothetical protein
VAVSKRRERKNLRSKLMNVRNEITVEDKQLLNFLRTLTDKQLLLLIALVVMKDSRVRETILGVIQQ